MKMMQKFIVYSVLIVSSVIGSLNAQNATGGFSAPYFQADYTHDLTEYSSALLNPALMYRLNQMRAELAYFRWNKLTLFDDAMGYMQAGFFYPIRLRHTVGLNFLLGGSRFVPVDADDVFKGSSSVVDAVNKNIQGSFFENWIITSYSYKALPFLSVGTNVKLVLQNQFGDIRAGWGLDLGFYYTAFDHYRYGDLAFSLAFVDIKPANTAWTREDKVVVGGEVVDSKTFESNQLLNTRLRIGTKYMGANDRFIASTEVVADNAMYWLWDGLIDDDSPLKQKGWVKDTTIEIDTVNNVTDTIIDSSYVSGESYKEVKWRFSGHLKFMLIPQVWLKAGWANNNMPYLGLNYNVIFNSRRSINYVNIDLHGGYSFIDRTRGPYMMMKLSSDFGPTREQRESVRAFERLMTKPNELYAKAMRLYKAGKYWEASFAFGEIVSTFPSFHLNDKVTYYMGDCYLKLRMNKNARKVFKQGLIDFTSTTMRASYLYGLQLLDFREGNIKNGLKNYAFISSLYPNDPIKPDADYLAGEMYFQQKNYSAAEQVLTMIKPGTDAYYYGQLTLSVINIIRGKKDAAIQNLRIVSEGEALTTERVKLRNAASVKLGQMFYEEVKLTQAVDAFKRVGVEDVHGDEALLGIAWSYIRVNRPETCIKAADQLINYHPQSPLIPEAYLVKGYSYLLLKKLPRALKAMNDCKKLCETNFASDADLSQKRDVFYNVSRNFAPVEENIHKTALRKQTKTREEQQNALFEKYKVFKKEADDYFIYKELVKNNRKFYRRKDQILLDCEYSIATIENMMTKSGMDIKHELKKRDEIEGDIEQLERELEELEKSGSSD